MFNKLKELKELKGLRDKMGKETVKVEKEGVSVVVNGRMEVEEINVNGQIDPEVIKQCINNGLKEMQGKVVDLLK